MSAMVRLGFATLWLLLSSFSASAQAPEEGRRLVWSVESPFRFYRASEPFERHLSAYDAVLAQSGGQIPPDVIQRMERLLNAVDCSDRSTPDRCYETASDKNLFDIQQAGWAAASFEDSVTCYESKRARHRARCPRAAGGKTFDEDYILPEAHTVRIGLPDDMKRKLGGAACVWTWRPRLEGETREDMRSLRCSEDLVIDRVPYASDPAKSGVAVDVTLPDGSALFEPDVMVTDLFVVGLGDSFASGEGNPDKPARFSPWRTMRYANECGQSTMAQAPAKGISSGFSGIPRRLLPDDRLTSDASSVCNPDGRSAFLKNGASWLSPECHRSQYSYQFRVALTLALEDRHRAVTLAHLSCTGAEATAGLFEDKEAREGFETNKNIRAVAQFRQLTDMLCRDKERAKKSYDLPTFTYGKPETGMKSIKIDWCPPQSRKRPVDMVLLSIGGNDVGFSALAAYGITESAADLGRIVDWFGGGEVRFAPKVARSYLNVLDERLAAVKAALKDGFGVSPGQVVQTSYEAIQYDENNRPDDGSPQSICGSEPQLGMDVHPGLRMSRERLKEVDVFVTSFLERLECISGRRQHKSCPQDLATGRGTGFRLVTEHQEAFMNRGICARDPARLKADTIDMTMPRRQGPDAFKPYSPARFMPYVSRWRLFRTPNDSYLIANTHAECRGAMCPHLDDFLQVAFAALYSGAIHPTAQAHALIADYALVKAREVLAKQAMVKTIGDDEQDGETLR